MIFTLSILAAFLVVGFFAYLFEWNRNPKCLGFAAGICLVLSLGLSAISLAGGHSKASAQEVWNLKINRVEYYEPWNEKVSCRHPHMVSEEYTDTESRQDKKGRSYTVKVRKTRMVQKGWEHAFDVDYHDPEWKSVDENGDSHDISQSEYHKWAMLWGEKFQDLNRNYYTINGNEYYAQWDGTFPKMYPFSEIHTYENRIRVTENVWNTFNPSEADEKQYPRPAESNNTTGLLSFGPAISSDEELVMRRTNALLGKTYQIHNIVVLMNESDRDRPDVILNAWRGPNKNELVTFVGVDGARKVQWCKVYSWCEDTTIHSLIRQDVNEMGIFDVNKISQIIQNRVPKYWHRRHFSDFSYIKIHISVWWYVLSISLSLVLSGVTCVVVENKVG